MITTGLSGLSPPAGRWPIPTTSSVSVPMQRNSRVSPPPMIDGSVDLSVADEDGNRAATSFVKALNGSQA